MIPESAPIASIPGAVRQEDAGSAQGRESTELKADFKTEINHQSHVHQDGAHLGIYPTETKLEYPVRNWIPDNKYSL